MCAMTWDPTPGYDERTALLVVDVQNDFADPEGSLFVPAGDTIVEPVNEQVRSARDGGATVVFTQDWHPERTPHFEPEGGTWPVHCVHGTWGAALHPGLLDEADLILRKGTTGADGYSAFTVRDPHTGATTPTGLAGYLTEREITTVVVVGLAADVCVRETALDAVSAGFSTMVPWRCTRPVDPDAGSDAAHAMRQAGVQVVGAS